MTTIDEKKVNSKLINIMGVSHTKASEIPQLRAKCLIVGQQQVGKTCFVQRYNNEEFNNDYSPTLGCNLKTFSIDYYGLLVQLLVMDSLSDMDLQLECRLKSIKNADSIALAFDLSNFASCQDISSKIDLFKKNEYRNKELLLIGTKADKENLEVSSDDIQKIIDTENEIKISYIETSAKNGLNIAAAFMKVVEISVGMQTLNWERRKNFLWIAKKIMPPTDEEDGGRNLYWANLCEAIPNMISKKGKKRELPLYRIPPELIPKIAEYL
ncbi:unnamed protein product [Blepharisma stoltei]|uniref:Uncharacterized protein n=1 Tax=Blepharisma stoltei TaxID=1481888 RepID=A0AAU9IYJ9_9CILI|nr:unnamed protein product [Blepharisma stoltei]